MKQINDQSRLTARCWVPPHQKRFRKQTSDQSPLMVRCGVSRWKRIMKHPVDYWESWSAVMTFHYRRRKTIKCVTQVKV